MVRLGLDVELRAMAQQHMLDDGQPQAGAAGLARAALVDPVETLGQPGNVFRAYADAIVPYRELRPLPALPCRQAMSMLPPSGV